MSFSELYRIGDFLISLSDSLFLQNENHRMHLIPFRITDQTELLKYKDEIDMHILDRRTIRSSCFNLKQGQLLFEEMDCSNPTRLYLMSDGSYGCEMYDGTSGEKFLFHISNNWSVIDIIQASSEQEDFLFRTIGTLFAISLLWRDACVFHGVAMDYQGKGILVLAESGVGKSTHTNRWEAMGLASIVNGDRCLCRKIDGKWYAYGMPWAGSSGKHLQKKVPVNWIIDLKRGSENHVEDLPAFEQEIFLLQRIFSPVTYGEQQDRAFQYVHELATSSVVKRLYCLPDEESVWVLKAEIDKEDASI